MNLTTKCLLTSVSLLTASVLCDAQVTYDAKMDYSPTNNPTGVWTYGYRSQYGSSFTKFPANNGVGADNLSWWYRNPTFPTCFPAVIKNVSTNEVVGGGVVFAPNQLVLHPGESADAFFAVLRFTAPTTGVYRVSARFSGVYAAGTTSDVYILVNEKGLFSGNVRGYGSPSEVSTSPCDFTMRGGDIVDFIVSNGGNGWTGDYTALEATVTLLETGVVTRLYTAVEVEFNTELGKTYQVQSSTTPLCTDLTNVGPPVPGDGSLKYVFDSTRGQPKKFYRTVIVP